MQRETGRARWAFGALLVSLVAASAASAADFYVSPSGSATGTGSQGNPWDLQTALDQPAAVNPGDTIWLRGGLYTGYYVSHLVGTSANPILVKQYPGERARIDGNHAGTEPTLTINGSYTWVWGFEIFNSDPTRWSGTPGTAPPRRGMAVELAGTGTKMINMVLHDTTQGVLGPSAASATEIYGNLIYYNGYDSTDRGHGHGAYIQNDAGNPLKKIYDNVVLEQFGYGLHGYTTSDRPRQYRVQGQHRLRQRRPVEPRLGHEHPARRARERERPEADRQHVLQPGSRRIEQPGIQRGLLLPDRHREHLLDPDGPAESCRARTSR